MSGQLLIVALIVSAAVVYLGWQTWRTWTGHGKGCGKGCCHEPDEARPTGLITSEQLTARLRETRLP